jgi:hypothetical protein
MGSIIDEGTTGYICESVEDMKFKLFKLGSINRTECRNHAIKRFNVSEIARKYLSLSD